MKLLLDTHTFIWWDSEPGKLSGAAMSALTDSSNTVALSVVSVLEIVVKAQLGKLPLRMPVTDIVAQQQAKGIVILDLKIAHVLAVESLPSIHRDPLNRLLVAQANAEGATLETADPIVGQYPVQVLW